MMRRLLINNGLIVSVSAVCFGVGVVVSVFTHNFQWLARFGALVACAGIIALARPNISGHGLLPEIILANGGKSNDPNAYRDRGEPIPDVVVEDRKSQIAVGVIGPWLCFTGTAISGFADLLNKLFCWQ